ncbi:hypothetical protein Q1695_002199 [Nippostrongylus brasiliensis]|nr:hypothetical protein Q1695_002199 [Nippostrongylus brasiliensis]
MHNNFRSTVALGLTAGNGFYSPPEIAPPAALMYRLAIAKWTAFLATGGLPSNMIFSQKVFDLGRSRRVLAKVG